MLLGFSFLMLLDCRGSCLSAAGVLLIPSQAGQLSLAASQAGYKQAGVLKTGTRAISVLTRTSA